MVCIKTLLLAFCGAASALPVTPGSDSRLAVPETKDFDATDASDIEKRSVSLPNNHVSKLEARVSPAKLLGIYTLTWDLQGKSKDKMEVMIQVGDNGLFLPDNPAAHVSHSRYGNIDTLLVSYESGGIKARSHIDVDATTKYIRHYSSEVRDHRSGQIPSRFHARYRPITEPGVPLPRPPDDIRRPSSSQSMYRPIGGQYQPPPQTLPRPQGSGQYPSMYRPLGSGSSSYRLPEPPGSIPRPSTSQSMYRPSGSGQYQPGAQALPRPPSRGQYPPGAQALPRPPGSGQYPPGYRPSRGPY